MLVNKIIAATASFLAIATLANAGTVHETPYSYIGSCLAHGGSVRADWGDYRVRITHGNLRPKFPIGGHFECRFSRTHWISCTIVSANTLECTRHITQPPKTPKLPVDIPSVFQQGNIGSSGGGTSTSGSIISHPIGGGGPIVK